MNYVLGTQRALDVFDNSRISQYAHACVDGDRFSVCHQDNYSGMKSH